MRLRIALLFAVTATLIVAATLVFSEWPERFIATVTVIGVAATVLAVPTFLTHPPPELTVQFRSPHPSLLGRAALTRNSDAHELVVWVRNSGRGDADAVEIRFDSGGAHLFNESGNAPDYHHLDPTVHPYRWSGRERTIAPQDEFPIARLYWRTDTARPARLSWSARARSMQPRHGDVDIELLDIRADGR